MSADLPTEIQAVLAVAGAEKLKAQYRREQPGAKTSIRFLHERNGEEEVLSWFHSPANFPIPVPAAGQTVRVLTEDALLVERVELSYEIVTGGIQHVTADVYVTVPST